MEVIATTNAPAAVGHYSQAIKHNGLVFISGQLGIVPDTGEKLLGEVEEQAEQVLKNLTAIVEASGSSMDKVIKCTVYITDVAFFPKVNEVYSKYFGDHKPARVIVPIAALPFGFKVEVEAIAAC